MTRKAIPTAIRKAVLEAANGHCQLCGKPSSKLQVDHHQAVAFGGGNEETNLRALCPACHDPKSRAETSAAAKADRIRSKRLGTKPKRWKRTINRGTVYE